MIRRDPHRRRPRFGFTLIELLVVIVIIGILISLLLPTIIAAVRKANEAKASAEIQTLALGLAKFKDTYGEFPPSRVILSESGVYSLTGAASPVLSDFQQPLTAMPIMNGPGSSTNLTVNLIGSPDISFGELSQRSLNFLRKMFPRATLAPDATGYWPDFNGNNIQDGTAANNVFLYLEGHECLVFFLGGIPNPASDGKGGTTYGTSGFGKEPVYPFKNSGVGGTAASTANRTPPSYEFRAERLVDPDGDGIPGYLDSYSSGGTGQFFAYFASYGSVGYDPNDVNFGDSDPTTIGTNFRIGLPTVQSNGMPGGNTVYSPCPNPYTSGLPTPINNTGGFNANQPASYLNVNSFQIVSAGGDGLFGPGGQWVSSTDHLPIPPNANSTPAGPYADQSAARPTEADNLSNFTAGRLN